MPIFKNKEKILNDLDRRNIDLLNIKKLINNNLLEFMEEEMINKYGEFIKELAIIDMKNFIEYGVTGFFTSGFDKFLPLSDKGLTLDKKIEIIKSFFPEFDSKGKSNEYIEERYNILPK